MQMQRKYRLAEVQRFAKLANIQGTEIPNWRRTKLFEIPQRNLADSPGVMKNGQVFAQ